MQKRYVEIDKETIPLDKFIKWSAVVETGGQAKMLIQDGCVKVNNVKETKRSRILKLGDIVEIGDELQLILKPGESEV